MSDVFTSRRASSGIDRQHDRPGRDEPSDWRWITIALALLVPVIAVVTFNAVGPLVAFILIAIFEISPFVVYFPAIRERRDKRRKSKEREQKAEMIGFFRRKRGVHRYHVDTVNVWVRATYSTPKVASDSTIESSILMRHTPVMRRLDAQRERYRFSPEMCRLEIKTSSPMREYVELPVTVEELQSKMSRLAMVYRSTIESQRRFEGKPTRALQEQHVGAIAKENEREAKLVSDAAQTHEGERFRDAEEKLTEAESSFNKEDYPSTVNNLNTALELRLKELLEIPLTMTKIKTANIIEIWAARRYPHSPYMSEARKHVLDIDNKTKHEGYTPTQKDCISAMASARDLFKKIRGFELTDDMKTKLHEALGIR